MRKLLFSALTLLLIFTAIGCDSNNDEESDADVFVGNWALVEIGDASGDLTNSFFAGVDDLTASFTSDNDFALAVDYNAVGEAAGNTDLALDGTYTVSESANTISLNVTAVGITLPLSYNIVNNDRIELSGPAAAINPLFGTNTYQGTVTIVVERQ